MSSGMGAMRRFDPVLSSLVVAMFMVFVGLFAKRQSASGLGLPRRASTMRRTGN